MASSIRTEAATSCEEETASPGGGATEQPAWAITAEIRRDILNGINRLVAQEQHMALAQEESWARVVRTLDRVPTGCLDLWIRINERILTRYYEASTAENMQACLETMEQFFDLPKLVLGTVRGSGRKRRRGGGTSGRRRTNRTTSSRMEAWLFSHDNQGRPTQRDTQHVQTQVTPQGLQQEEGNTTQSRRSSTPSPAASPTQEGATPEQIAATAASVAKCKQLLRQGFVTKAVKVLTTGQIVEVQEDPQALETLKRLHPPVPSNRETPPLPANAPVISVPPNDTFAAQVRRLDNGSSSGPSGMGGNHLKSLIASEGCLRGLAQMVQDLANGFLPEAAKRLVLASRLVALRKPNGGVRPIAVGEVIWKLTAIHLLQPCRSELASELQPTQMGVGVPGGIEKSIHSLTALVEDPQLEFAALTFDFTNAFNSVNRAHVLQALFDRHPDKLGRLWRATSWAYSNPSPLFISGEGNRVAHVLWSKEGVRQGDPLAPALFALAVKSLYADAIEGLEVKAVAILDDLDVIGPPSLLIEVHRRMSELAPDYGLQLRADKGKLLWLHRDRELPEEVERWANDTGT